MNVASAASKLREFGDSCDQTLDHDAPRHKAGSPSLIYQRSTRAAAVLLNSAPPRFAFCLFVSYEQKCVGLTCDTILIAILHLAWCLHEVRLGDADSLLRSIELPRMSAQCV